MIPSTSFTSSSNDHSYPIEFQAHMMETMEMNFFHNQPDSMKKAVEFFSERIASNLIKVKEFKIEKELYEFNNDFLPYQGRGQRIHPQGEIEVSDRDPRESARHFQIRLQLGGQERGQED